MNFNVENPANAFFGTVQGLQNLDANRMKLDQQRQQQAQQKQAAEQQQQIQARTQELMPMVKAGDYDATIELSTINPQIANAVTKAKESLKQGQDVEIANWIAGYQTAPDKEAYLAEDLPGVDIDDNFRGMDPEQRDSLTKIVGAQVMPKAMFEATFGGGQEQGLTPAQQAADKRANERLSLDRDKLNFEKEKAATPKQKPMSVFTERTLNEAQNAAYESYSSSDSIQSLADSYAENKGDLGGGFFGSAQESFKEFVGGEDEVTSLKKQYGRIKNSLVLKSLPQGPATDKDIEIFSKGFPSENADPEYIESFLRGMAKSQYLNGRFNEFKASYISEKGNTGGLMKAWKRESKDIKKDIDEKFPEQGNSSSLSNLSDEDLLNG